AAPAVSSARVRSLTAAFAVAVAISMLTPPLWTTYRPKFLYWPLESYVNGVHVFNEPQAWLFPLFPWSAFAFAGLAVGFLLYTGFARNRQTLAFLLIGVGGVAAGALSIVFDRSNVRLYQVYDYWHSHPNFFLMRCGILSVVLFLAFAWCRWGFADKG